MTRPKFIDDLAGVAGGAISALSGLGEEVEQLVRARVDEALGRLRLVRREEFDAVAELAANARAAGEDAAARIAALEARVAALAGDGTAESDTPAAPVAAEGAPDPHLDNEGSAGGPPPHDGA